MRVIRSIAIGVLSISVACQCSAQLGTQPERAAMKNIEKKRWAKAEGFLKKAIRKDSVNAYARYLFSLYFLNRENPAYQLDSAYRQIMRSLGDFAFSTPRERDKMKRFNLDSTALIRIRETIDSAAFEVARTHNTELGYIVFLRDHPFAKQGAEARELRNEVAYLDAVKRNTYTAFLDFLNKYPSAYHASEARNKYNRLLFEALTMDKKLSSYEQFLREHPETPFIKEIEKNIFELFTLSGEIERYRSFIQMNPRSSQLKKAYNIMFHILPEQEDLQGFLLTDSLENIRKLQANYLVPFLKNDRFGFMDKNGVEIMRPVIKQLKEEYKCGNISDDIIVVSDSILARDGHVIYAGSVAEIDDLGAGFLKLGLSNCVKIIHKSGNVMDDCVDDAKVLSNRFLALKKKNKWTVQALNGRKFIPDQWDDIAIHENVLAIKSGDQWQLVTLKQLSEFPERQKLSLTGSFDEIKMLPGGLLWVKSQAQQGILDQQLAYVISLDRHEIKQSFFGFIGKSPAGYSVYNRSGNQASYFQNVNLNEPWVAVSKNNEWYLFDPKKQEYSSKNYDSIQFDGPFVLGFNSDTLSVHFSEKNLRDFIQPLVVHFIPGKDSTSFLVTEAEGKKTVYNMRGKKLFSTAFDQILYAGQDLFIVSKKEKKGLMDASGKLLLPVEFDAIGSVTNKVITLLKAMKFGLYDIGQRKLIKPQYDKNLIPYSDKLITAYQGGLYGFIDWDNKPDGKFEFEEIRYWNDTTALTRKNNYWSLFDIADKSVLETGIKDITLIRDSEDEKLAIVHGENSYGVLSNRSGTVIPLTFSDLVNIGSSDEPLYFTEKHVSEASIFVVIYYDRNGKLLRREVYEEGDDYEKIYCPNN